ncbi:hypothetical protein ACFOOK_26275 [Micromonospora krabiensis]|uniref:Uncharacterized protein n=1 Tax=Micromonospora krabiensis TaxID=307121 RepID=A0A1C3N5V5_9ACTN|nr:hypothetical protein [Micromonospora krabiensis]SBV27926.1 hypothetical protein GA0070620_3457 [Micromonospora krabiensis]
MANLPPLTAALAERVPIEDFMLAALRESLPDIEVVTQIRKNQTFPVVLVRRLPTFYFFEGDERFLEQADVAVHAFASDPDGDRDAAIISDAVRVALRDAWLNGWGNADIGWLRGFQTLSPARRQPDWATASGPVQYADLPSNTWRYEGRYRLTVRKPTNHPYPL